jgi:hypothetical protein
MDLSSSHRPLQPGAIAPWLRQGARAAFGRAPQWDGDLQAHPAVPLVLVLLQWLLAALLQRLQIPGDAFFYPPALLTGWLFTAVLAWIAVLLRAPQAGLPSALQAFCLLLAQWLWIVAVWGGLVVGLVHAGLEPGSPPWQFVFWGGLLAAGLLQWLLLARLAPGRPRVVALALLLLLLAMAASSLTPWRLWYPARAAAAAGDEPEPVLLRLDQPTLEAQATLLPRQAATLLPQRPGVVDLYAVTFAPYAGEDVFKREGAMVSEVMAERFDAAGRQLQLVNHAQTAASLPWATPQNLQRAIEAAAARMDREEDVLFLHLTSHGARNGQLAAELWPLQVAPVTPQQLKRWLDDAGVRWRVISISACYSGSWIEPLAGHGTLVMTAADAEHTSYGCGRLSELTFFGRAVYDEQLRRHTRSFEAAHSAARPLIERREQEAGKTDGYSNPQMRAGAAIRERLARLQARLDASAAGRHGPLP